MILIQHKLLFAAVILSSIIVLFFSIFDILYDEQWLQIVLAVYAVLIIFTIVLLFFAPAKKTAVSKDIVEEFEKTLEGKLYHFKFKNCQVLFAIKK